MLLAELAEVVGNTATPRGREIRAFVAWLLSASPELPPPATVLIFLVPAVAFRIRPLPVSAINTLPEPCGTPFFFKQWGGVRKKKYGRQLDGRTYDEYPRRVAALIPDRMSCAEFAETIVRPFGQVLRGGKLVQVTSFTQIRPDILVHIEQQFDHVGIKLPPGPAFNFSAAGCQGLRRTVGAIRSDRVQSIRHGYKPFPEGYFFALQAPRASGAVVAFLMRIDDLRRFLRNGIFFSISYPREQYSRMTFRRESTCPA
jgi:hypothetical protein